MNTILAADETGTLHLPPSLLPHPGPGRLYRVSGDGKLLIVNEEKAVLKNSHCKSGYVVKAKDTGLLPEIDPSKLGQIADDL